MFEKERRAVAERSAICDLGEERHAGDFCAAAVGAFEGFDVGRALLFIFFKFVCLDDESECGVVIDDFFGVAEAGEGVAGF